MSKIIILEPAGGLANRFCTLLSGMRLAQHFKAKLLLEWNKGADCAADFEDLFYNPFESNTLYKKEECEFQDIYYADNEDGWTHSPVIDSIPEDKPLWIASHFILAHPEDNRHPRHYCLFDSLAQEVRAYFSYLQPIPVINQRIAAFDGIDFSKVWGMHIRRPYQPTSKHHEIESARFKLPSDDSYIQIAQKILDSGRFEKIFLATNDFRTQQALLNCFGDKVFFHPKKSVSNDNNTEAVQDGLVDMLLLSRCACLSRFFNSSFAYMATLLGLKTTLTIAQVNQNSPITYGVNYFRSDRGFCEESQMPSFENAMAKLTSPDTMLGTFHHNEPQTA